MAMNPGAPPEVKWTAAYVLFKPAVPPPEAPGMKAAECRLIWVNSEDWRRFVVWQLERRGGEHEFKKYRFRQKSDEIEMRPWRERDDVFVPRAHEYDGQPRIGDMIARRGKGDLGWLVTAERFAADFEEVK